MIRVRSAEGWTEWNVGEPLPSPALTAVEYVIADGPELEHVQNRIQNGLKMPLGATVGKWIGHLAATVWANV